MGNYRYYAGPHKGMHGPFGLFIRFIALSVVCYGFVKWDYYEDLDEAGGMRDNTFAYFKRHTQFAQHPPNKPLFPRLKNE